MHHLIKPTAGFDSLSHVRVATVKATYLPGSGTNVAFKKHPSAGMAAW